MKNAGAIFDFLLAAADREEPAALVTITDVIGSSSRDPGTHMAVARGGAFIGSFSGGCVEAAVIAEAQRAIAEGRPRQVRFGAGSPYLDIRLPCGGGIDLLIHPAPPARVIGLARDELAARRPVTLRMRTDGDLFAVPGDGSDNDGEPSSWQGDVFSARHQPDLRLLILGHGAEVPTLSALARAYGIDVTVLSPEPIVLERAAATGAATRMLKTPGPSPYLTADRHTAVVFLFHDHDWEVALMAQALAQETLFIGAMGSRRTHARRIEMLIAHGVDSGDAARIVGPVGLIPATRDPDTLALSVLAQIVGHERDNRTEQFRPIPNAAEHRAG